MIVSYEEKSIGEPSAGGREAASVRSSCWWTAWMLLMHVYLVNNCL